MSTKDVAGSMRRLRAALQERLSLRTADLAKPQDSGIVYVNPVVEPDELRKMLSPDAGTTMNSAMLLPGDTVDVWATVAQTKRIVDDSQQKMLKWQRLTGIQQLPRYRIQMISTERTRVRRVQ